MAQGKGGGQDSSGEDGMGPDAFDGGPQGSPSGDHPDNDPSTGLNYGGNQTDADLNFDSSSADADAVRDAMRGWDTPGLAFGAGSPTGAHPDSTTNQHYGTGLSYGSSLGSTNYSAYDDPETHDHQDQSYLDDSAPMSVAPPSPHMGMNLSAAAQTKAAANAAMSKAFGMDDEEAIARTSTALHTMQQDDAINLSATTAPPSTSLSLGPYGTMATEDTDYDTTLDPMAVTSIDTESYDQVHAPVTQAQHALDVIEQENIAKALAAKNISLNAPTTAQIEEARQRHRAIEARQWGKTALDAKTAWGVLDAQLKETETKTYFGIEMQVPKMSKYDKEKALVAFRDKYGKQIEAYNKHYNYQAKQSKQEPGLMNPPAMLAGLINPILGMVVRIGQKYGYNESPMEKAITAAEIDAGIKEADHGEGVDQFTCEAKGYTWNEGLQACYRSDGTLFAGSERSNTVSSGV